MRFLAAHGSAARAAARAAGGTAVVVVACGLVLAACGSVPAPGTPSAGSTPSVAGTTPASAAPSAPATSPSAGGSSAGGLAACTTAQLKVGLTNTGALGGQAGGYLRFTNDGPAACQMDGWPAVTAVTAAGQATALRHARSTMYGAWQAPSPLPAVTLPPGASAYAVVAAADQPAGSAVSCPAPYVRLRVAPPGGGSGGSGGVVVSAWLPGARSYLPSCAAIDGATTGEVSAITPLSALPH